jgi:hypothetical protein
MKNILLYGILIGSFLVSCNKENQHSNPNAEIIKFNPDKCGCCWGWAVRIGKDTIKTDDARFGDLFGFDITKPVPVYIELGDRDQTCSLYFKINKIELIK